MFTNKDHINRTWEILLSAIKQYKPSKILVSYSGGHDSATVLHLMDKIEIKFDVLTIDTGISTDGHITRIYNEVVNKLNKRLWIYSNNGAEWYKQQVLDNGFAYTPVIHTIYYRMLKERALMTALRDFKKHRTDNIMFVTGVRRAESVKRRHTPLISKSGSRIFCNLIAEFTDEDKHSVMKDNTWFKGKTTEDCMCNWHCKYKLSHLEESPQLHKYMANLESDMRDMGLWGYGEKPDPSLVQVGEIDDDEMPDDSLCVNCYTKTLF